MGTWSTYGRLARTAFLVMLLPGVLFWVFSRSPLGSAVFGLTFGAVFLLALFAILGRVLLRRELARTSSQQIVLTPEAIERIAPGGVCRQPWAAATHVLDTPVVYLLVNRRVPIASIEKSAIHDTSTRMQVQSLIASLLPIVRCSSGFLALERHPSEA